MKNPACTMKMERWALRSVLEDQQTANWECLTYNKLLNVFIGMPEAQTHLHECADDWAGIGTQRRH